MSQERIQEWELVKNRVEFAHTGRKGRYSGGKGVPEFYKYYLSNGGEKISRGVFKNILLEYNSFFSELVMTTCANQLISQRLGYLTIRKNKIALSTKVLKMDFKATKENNEKMYHLNEHSQGFFYRFKWVKNPTENITKFTFIPCRSLKRELSRRIKEKEINL